MNITHSPSLWFWYVANWSEGVVQRCLICKVARSGAERKYAWTAGSKLVGDLTLLVIKPACRAFLLFN